MERLRDVRSGSCTAVTTTLRRDRLLELIEGYVGREHEARLLRHVRGVPRLARAHHATATELWVGLYKKGSGRPSITWPEAVDEALCFGWIDGVRQASTTRAT